MPKAVLTTHCQSAHYILNKNVSHYSLTTSKVHALHRDRDKTRDDDRQRERKRDRETRKVSVCGKKRGCGKERW